MPGEFWIAAGINGAGKSSVVAAEGIADVIGPVRFLNPDLPVPSLRAHLAGVSLEEANLAAVVGVEAIVGLRVGRAETVGVETVLSSDKYLKHVRAARQRGMLVGMVYVALPDVELAIARVRDRRALGGHDVPEASVRARWARTHDNLAAFAPSLDVLFVFSNADPAGRPVLVARTTEGGVEVVRRGLLPEIDSRF